MATILVTCAGSGVGQSVLDSLNLLREHKILGCDTNRNVYAHHFCDRFFVVPNIYSEGYIEFILKLCINENVDLIIPGHDHELSLLSRNISKFDEKGIEVIVSRPDLIEISRDKYHWYKYFIEYGCPIVPTFKVADFIDNPDESIFPAIIKPTAGSASQGILIINKKSELTLMNDSDIIQPYLFPRKDDPNYDTICKVVKSGKFVQMSEISMQLIFTKESEFAGIFISKNTLKNGVPTFVDPINPEEFEYIEDIMKFVPICIEKKVKGPVNIQGRITEKGLICFEMNMRFTGITGNRAQLGFNEVAFLVDNFLGKKATLMGYAKNKLGVRQVACITIPRKKEKENNKKTYTILGASGFIGSHFINALIKENNFHKINLVCRDSSYNKYLSLFPYKGINTIRESDQMVETVYCQSDVLVNFVSALAYHPDIEKFNSIIFQYNQLEKIIKANIPLIINVSSQSVYDQKSDFEKDENASLLIDNLYAFQKHIAEKFFNSIESFSPSLKVMSLRFSRVIGPHFTNRKPEGFFAKVIEDLLNDQIVRVPFPNNKINLIDIRDVMGAILFVINDSDWKELPKIMNVGGTNISIKDYCERVVECLGHPEKKKFIQYSDNLDVTTSSLINSNLIAKYGWTHNFSLGDSINEIKNKLTEFPK